MAACIRAADITEREALDGLRRRAAYSFEGMTEELLAHPQALHISPAQISAGRILVAELDGTIAGFAAWRPIGDSTAELEGILVDPPLWHGGIGAELLRAVCEAVTANGFKNLFVTAVPPAAEFYRRCGFVRTGATYTPIGPALTLMKAVTTP